MTGDIWMAWTWSDMSNAVEGSRLLKPEIQGFFQVNSVWYS